MLALFIFFTRFLFVGLSLFVITGGGKADALRDVMAQRALRVPMEE
jgi:hypothetical protein